MSLKHALLAAISLKPQTGYELGKQIDGSIGYFWNASLQQIYKELGELDSAGWLSHKGIHQEEKPDKKLYRITKPGLKELKRWIGLDAKLPPAKDALLIKLFAGHLVPPQILIGVLERHTEKRRARLAKYQMIETTHFKNLETLPDELQFQYLTVRRGIHFETAWLEWADETLKFLKTRAGGNARPMTTCTASGNRYKG